MHRSIYSGIGCLLFLAGCNAVESSPGQSGDQSVTASIASMVRAEYDGNSAMETVAFLDQYIRWPGNRGFDASIDHVAGRLEKMGFVREDQAMADARLTYRVEEYPMEQPAWEPLNARITIEGETGGTGAPILDFSTNRNMLAKRSYSTPEGGVTAELIDVGSATSSELDALDIRGKIVLMEGRISGASRSAVVERGAVGVLAYDLPEYLQPSKNTHSVQFRSIPNSAQAQSWGISLSTDARDRLQDALSKGRVRVHVMTKVRWTESAVERTVVADVLGSDYPDERFVFSAHVQEPGANDNASGVGAQMEMARVTAALLTAGKIDPRRSITFLWGDEIRSTGRYVTQDTVRARGIHWGLSLDMVGEDTKKTGGTFLIEKMPDPSAIWTRGDDHHTEWGTRPVTREDLFPHYFNDLVLGRALEQAKTNGWAVKTNPFEGGSDHVPFLQGGIPGLLFWHFTDQFYHTDRDRLEMVSADEMKNVGVTALVTAFSLTSADGDMARAFIGEVRSAALARLEAEAGLSQAALQNGGELDAERDIIGSWSSWYQEALSTTADIEVGGSSDKTKTAIEEARREVRFVTETALASFRNSSN